MPYRISFVCDDEAEAQTFVNDSDLTGGLICYTNTNGDDIEWAVRDVKYEEI